MYQNLGMECRAKADKLQKETVSSLCLSSGLIFLILNHQYFSLIVKMRSSSQIKHMEASKAHLKPLFQYNQLAPLPKFMGPLCNSSLDSYLQDENLLAFLVEWITCKGNFAKRQRSSTVSQSTYKIPQQDIRLTQEHTVEQMTNACKIWHLWIWDEALVSLP